MPKGPCTQIVDTLALKYLNRDYFKAKVYTTWVHGPLGFRAFHSSGLKWCGSFPRGSYPTPFLGRLLFKITDPNHKTGYPKG